MGGWAGVFLRTREFTGSNASCCFQDGDNNELSMAASKGDATKCLSPSVMKVQGPFTSQATRPVELLT